MDAIALLGLFAAIAVPLAAIADAIERRNRPEHTDRRSARKRNPRHARR